MRLFAPFLLIVFLLSSTQTLTFQHIQSQSPSAYEVLQSYNLPPGLLPAGAIGYELDPTTGKFAAHLPNTCSFSLDGSYQLRYKPTITGYISNNRIHDLKGVTVKILFVWVNIVEITRNGDDLDFSVGIASAGFGIDNFFVCPQCGCGLNCKSLPEGRDDQ